MKRKTKKILKGIGLAALGLGVLVGGANLIKNVAEDKDSTTEKINLTYEVGGLNDLGKYVEDDGTLYTKNAFECKGLTIDIDFDSNVQYQVFFYTEDDVFVESTEVLTDDYKIDVEDESITHARIEITPNWDMLEVKKDDDQVIKWYETYKYSKQLKVSVDKDQSPVEVEDVE